MKRAKLAGFLLVLLLTGAVWLTLDADHKIEKLQQTILAVEQTHADVSILTAEWEKTRPTLQVVFGIDQIQEMSEKVSALPKLSSEEIPPELAILMHKLQWFRQILLPKGVFYF